MFNLLIQLKSKLSPAINKIIDDENTYGKSDNYDKLLYIYLTYWYFTIVKNKVSEGAVLEDFLDKDLLKCLVCNNVPVKELLALFDLEFNLDSNIGIEFTYIVEGKSSFTNDNINNLVDGCYNFVTDAEENNNDDDDIIVVDPVPLSKIYFGAVSGATVIEADVLAFAYVLVTNFLNTEYTFVPLVATYKYIVVPNSLGVVNDIIDPSTGFNVAVINQGTLVVNGANHTVYRTTNIINGTLKVKLI